MRPMADVDQAERYDRIAEGYAHWWAPVLAPAVTELLDRLEPMIAAGARRLVDVGTGTAQLALGALERWPTVEIVGVDPSSEMCAMADAEADRRLPAAMRDRFRSTVAFADALPLDDASVDAAVSSFVLQLVPNRARALREARRVVRPGGHLAFVTWLQDERAFAPDRIFDEVLDELGVEPPEPDMRSGDLPSVERTANEVRRAGFRDATAEGSWLAHAFTVDGYVAFMTEFDEASLFEELDAASQERLLGGLRERLARLTSDELTMRFPIVFASGRRGAS
jgi:ubiquinone/menaquinone biosynthesis C-methylase UbiE